MTLPLGWINLMDKFPGEANPNLGIPTGGWANTTDNCVTLPTYPVGTKIQAYTDNTLNPGYYTMMYAAFCSYCAGADISQDYSEGTMWCGHCDLTSSTDDSTYEIPDYTGDFSALPMCWLASCYTESGVDISKGGPVAVPCCTLDGYDYGWFWVGGVCPQADVTIFKGLADAAKGADVSSDALIVGGKFYIDITTDTGALLSFEWSATVDTSYGNCGMAGLAMGDSV